MHVVIEVLDLWGVPVQYSITAVELVPTLMVP